MNTMVNEKMVTEHSELLPGISLGREDQLLIHCARLELSQARRDAIKELTATGINWDLILERAAWHRLSCLVSHHLRTAGLSELVPQAVLQKLHRINYANLARNMLLQDGLSQILSAFNQEEIPIIVLKGAALLGTVYHDISLRPMSDLDILVQPQHLDRAEIVALHQGYIYTSGHNVQESFKANSHQLPFLIHHNKGIVLEIHQHIVDSNSPYRFDLGGFWHRARPISILGSQALTLAPEDQLLHLSIHFIQDRRYHSNSALGQLCDISEVILHYGDSLDWNLIEKFTEENGITSGLHCVLYACKHLLHTQMPDSVLRKLQPRDFNQALTHAFLLRRVLDTRPWLAHDLVASQHSYRHPRIFWAIIRRLFHVPEEVSLEQRIQTYLISFYFKRLKNIIPKLGRMLIRPKELKQELLLDQWFHNIFNSNIRA